MSVRGQQGSCISAPVFELLDLVGCEGQDLIDVLQSIRIAAERQIC
jgi:hypothetical protein